MWKTLRRLLRPVKKLSLYISKKSITFIISFSELTRTEFELKRYIDTYYDEYYLRRNYSKLISRILDGKLIHFDIGSRHGTQEIVKKYATFMEIIMCEPERKEAANLRKEGYKIIEKAMFREAGEVTLFETRLPAGSSIYKQQGLYADFYNPDPNYMSLYDAVKEITMECSTISRELSALEVPELDFLKIDTEGSELDVLMGLGDYRPLVMTVEINYLPRHSGGATAYEVCQYLFELGYIPFSLTSYRPNALCPMVGDGFFMPSWVDPKGIELIRSREEKYIALMLMFGQTKILKFVAKKLKLRNEDFIETLPQ